MNNFLTIGIYRRRDNRASLVFKKKGILYRITTIDYAKHFAVTLNIYGDDLKKNRAEPNFIEQMHSPRKRNFVLEIGLVRELAVLKVYEAETGFMKQQFIWKGSKNDLNDALKDFWVMTYWGRI